MKTEENKTFRCFMTWAFTQCPEITAQWHENNEKGHDFCLKKSLEELRTMDTLRFYIVTEGPNTVGYFGSEYFGRYMPTIFVHPRFRDRKSEFWEQVQSKMKPEWAAGIYTKNLPAFKFYSKMGEECDRSMSKDGEIAVFKFKRLGVY